MLPKMTGRIFLFVFIALLVPLHSFMMTAAFSASLPGDVNGDGRVNLTDALMVLQAVTGSSDLPSSSLLADMGGDLKIGAGEAIYVLQCTAQVRIDCPNGCGCTILPDTQKPAVMSVFPSPGAIGYPVTTVVKAVFSEAMDPSTINSETFSLSHNGAPVAGTIAYHDLTALFTPISPLGHSATYSALITEDAKDLAGNTLAGNVPWTFTTSPQPRPGNLDDAYGDAGLRIVSFGGLEEEARALALQPDGKALVGGFADVTGGRKFALLRLDADGALDLAFGSGGKVITTFDTSNWDIINALAVEQGGKIVAAGGYGQFALARYNPDGSPDVGFGAGGKVRTAVAVQSVANSIAIQPDGKIIAGGMSSQANTGDIPFTLIRYNSDGSLDPLFGSGGIVQTLVAGQSANIRSIALQPDGKIVAAGYTAPLFDFAVMRFNADGSVDTSFGTDGSVVVAIGALDDTCYAVCLQPDGKIVAAGETMSRATSGVQTGSPVLVRLTAQGSLDQAFGSGGKVVATSAQDSRAWGLALQADGKMVTAGFSFNEGFALLRYNSDGSPDMTFGTGGKATSNAGDLAAAWAIAIQNDGKILSAGFSSTGRKDFAVARFLP